MSNSVINMEEPMIEKRLSFSDVNQQLATTEQLDIQAVIKALKTPSIDNYQHALEILNGGYQKRFDVVLEKSRELSAEAGEADLRRLKRQFSSLKNTFLHYVVKDEFIAGLADGMPNGTEDIQLSRFDEEAQRNIETLRELKDKNCKVQDEILALISNINGVVADIQQRNRDSVAEIEKLREEIAASEAAEAALPSIDPEDGPNEEECAAALAAEEAEARVLESQLVTQMGQIAEIEASLRIEKESEQFERAEKEDLEQQLADLGDVAHKASAARFSGISDWADEAIALLQSIGGIKIQNYDKDNAKLHLTTTYPIATVRDGHLGACHHGTHEISVVIDPRTNSVTSASLTPPDIEVQDIVEALSTNPKNGAQGYHIATVIREVRSRLASKLHRSSLVQAALAKFPGSVKGNSDTSVTTTLALPNGRSVTVEAILEHSWPGWDDTVIISSLSMNTHNQDSEGTESEKIRKLHKIKLEGKGFVEAFEFVQQELSSS